MPSARRSSASRTRRSRRTWRRCAVAGVAWHAAVTKARAPAAGVDTRGSAPARHAATRRALSAAGEIAGPGDVVLPDPEPTLASASAPAGENELAAPALEGAPAPAAALSAR